MFTIEQGAIVVVNASELFTLVLFLQFEHFTTLVYLQNSLQTNIACLFEGS